MRGRARLGVQAFADGLLVIPKTLARNSGFDAQDTIVKLQEESQVTGEHVGLDVSTGEAILPADEGILDNYCVKRQLLMSWYEHGTMTCASAHVHVYSYAPSTSCPSAH